MPRFRIPKSGLSIDGLGYPAGNVYETDDEYQVGALRAAGVRETSAPPNAPTAVPDASPDAAPDEAPAEGSGEGATPADG